MSEQRDWKSIFIEVFSAPPSLIEATIFGAVCGDEYPSEMEPYNYITRSELPLFVKQLNTDQESLLLDIACGRGGPGLWVASRTGSSVVGVDISPTAIADATERAQRLGLASRSRYVTGDFSAIPIDDRSVHAVMCIDALIFAADKSVAIDEIARVLRPGGGSLRRRGTIAPNQWVGRLKSLTIANYSPYLALTCSVTTRSHTGVRTRFALTT